MKIHNAMNLDVLKQLMGASATVEDAQHMRALLVELFPGDDTRAIPEIVWGDMLIRAVRLSYQA